ncbi:sucrose-phosphatase 1-like [Cornus florida]|uniref:sucrose-phosphatase 1-like n=1 Tax=Cornus florida TaxID=4283 RepID=UPI0028996D77|nr:sucrose-phosphatase 1-like [Cornus florida]XP_059646549.1 sucrose-phosphatase 1-like [Cornus florida]XP_059646550.1 sucrose-phosphatase 1-like [Cornus florida]XP_059646551.1 sucrose-phosphatase 1-like [Cornus florida]XP_059646553.1 sucrose-phosphatase 1-like [Cornus florida]XP_059646554.1 sucrose-phosphatase 1-like [Cornus florida]
MDRLKSSARLMIVSDLDHTMVDHHDPENLSLLRFNALWEANYRHDSLLVFSTGRSPTLYKQLRKEKPMLTPDITIMSVGTEITYGNSMVPDDGWVECLNQKWDRNIVTEETSKFSELTLHAETEQRPHKVSFYVQKEKAQQVMKALSGCLEKRGLNVKIIYSGGMDLDILPQGAGKGQALAYLLKKFKTEGKLPINTLACGDSGNDAELFSIPEVYGVMVSNAQEELLKWHAENAKDNPKIIHATERCAAGIIQAIGRFNLGPSTSPRDVTDFEANVENPNPGNEIVKFYLFYEKWRHAEVENSALYLAGLKANCHPPGVHIHPSGCEKLLRDCIDALKGCYGDKQGKQFRVWVDQVLSTKIGSNTWLVKFTKWELNGEERCGCMVTVLLSSNDESVSEGFTWVHVHQTWLDGLAAKDHTTWFI